jgi:hypothetical protein
MTEEDTTAGREGKPWSVVRSGKLLVALASAVILGSYSGWSLYHFSLSHDLIKALSAVTFDRKHIIPWPQYLCTFSTGMG